MVRSLDWKSYIDQNGDFELAKFLYQSNLSLMKYALDMGTLLSTDQARLRAYKEQIKAAFKGSWLDTAKALEYFDIIVPCVCSTEYCRICGGARYRLNATLSPDMMEEIFVATNGSDDPERQKKLEEGLQKALQELADSTKL
jgi:hypothetical protein